MRRPRQAAQNAWRGGDATSHLHNHHGDFQMVNDERESDNRNQNEKPYLNLVVNNSDNQDRRRDIIIEILMEWPGGMSSMRLPDVIEEVTQKILAELPDVTLQEIALVIVHFLRSVTDLALAVQKIGRILQASRDK
jgi:hypothetical protein